MGSQSDRFSKFFGGNNNDWGERTKFMLINMQLELRFSGGIWNKLPSWLTGCRSLWIDVRVLNTTTRGRQTSYLFDAFPVRLLFYFINFKINDPTKLHSDTFVLYSYRLHGSMWITTQTDNLSIFMQKFSTILNQSVYTLLFWKIPVGSVIVVTAASEHECVMLAKRRR